jgi:UDP-glucuronate 4-epimerase
MKVMVTGCAGFIGSHAADECLARGHRVIGVDMMTDYYSVAQKQENLDRLLGSEQFDHLAVDLVELPDGVLDDVEVVYHLAGQPGVRQSWRDEFNVYLARNVLATQRLLELSASSGVARFIYSSSSSVYGNAESYPVDESMRPQPFSPYGVTKLAGEHLCTLYAQNFGLPVVSLRYFTVYGPAQRPDMATHRLFEAALTGSAFPLYGTGEQLRDFTFVDDVVRANLLAAEADVEPGLVFNIAGGGECSMLELIELVEQVSGREIEVDRRDVERGDVHRTGASIDRAARRLGWAPQVSLRHGLEQQHEWHLHRQ